MFVFKVAFFFFFLEEGAVLSLLFRPSPGSRSTFVLDGPKDS